MNRTEAKGLVFGFFLGLFLLWWNWPDGAHFTDTQLARSAGYILGTMLACWIIARMIRKGNR